MELFWVVAFTEIVVAFLLVLAGVPDPDPLIELLVDLGAFAVVSEVLFGRDELAVFSTFCLILVPFFARGAVGSSEASALRFFGAMTTLMLHSC